MIHLTQEAAIYIKNIFREKGIPDNSAIRVTVKGGGCSGFTMDVGIEEPKRFEMPRRTDNAFVSNDVRVLVDKKSLLFVSEMKIKLEKHQFGHKLTFDNPNAKGFCGCGESFSI